MLAVSKAQNINKIKDAYKYGQKDFGENYLQESINKINNLKDLNINWHFIGNIQSNKSRLIAENFSWVHSIDKISTLEKINNFRKNLDSNLNICIQINLDEENTKSGIKIDEVENFLEKASGFENINIRGLMAIPKYQDNNSEQYNSFMKIRILFDPIIEVNQSRIKCNSKNITEHKDYYLAVGRLTTQKNFIFLCKAFHKIVLKSPNAKLLIAGDGEDKKIINSYIIQNKLEKNIIILGHVENVFPLMANAKLFILSSLWEDPGFVLVEALFCRTLVLTSNCKTGPAELIKDKKNGYIFESNNMESFINKFNELNLSQNNFKLKANGLRTVKKFTLFEHFISFKQIIL